MAGLGEMFAGWWLHAAIGGGFLLLLVHGLTWLCRQPASKQRLIEWGIVAALLVAGLSLAPAWLRIPVWNANVSEMSGPASVHSTHEPTTEPDNRADNESTDILALLPPIAAEDAAAAAWILVPSDSDHSGASSDNVQAKWKEESVCPIEPKANPTVTPPSYAGWDFLIPNRTLVLAGLAAAYLLIAGVFLIRWLAGNILLWRLLAQSDRGPEWMQNILMDLAGDNKQLPRILVSSRISVPFSCGLLRPTIVLPQEMIHANQTELVWILRHELAHLRRHDSWTCFLFGLGRVVYFYLPWFWSLWRRVRLCQEYVADAAAVQRGPEAADYAQYLLRLSQKATTPVVATGVSGNASDLFRRMTMLLANPFRVQSHCPRWLSSTAGFGLLSVSILFSGVQLCAQPANPPVDDQAAPQPAEKEKAKSEKKAPRGLPSEDEFKEGFQRFETPDFKRDMQQFDRMREQFDKMKEYAEKKGGPFAWQDVWQNNWNFQPQLAFQFSEGRLGIRARKPDPALADQLNLPENQGLIIEDVRPESAAAKAGLKAHDILLEFNGKPVANETAKLREMVEEVKAGAPVDAVVLRKAKKEAIKGITLPEVKKMTLDGAQIWHQPFDQRDRVRPLERVQPFFSSSGDGRHNIMTTIFRDNDRFTTRHQEGSLIITITGTVADAKAKISQIEIQDGRKTETYDSVDKVPDQYRDKVKNLLEINEKGTGKIEIRTPEKKKKPVEKPKAEGTTDA